MIVLAGGGWAWASSRRAEQVAARTRDVNDAVAEAKLHQGRARASAVEDLAPWTLAAGAGKRAGVLLAGGEVDPATRGQTVAFLVALADESRAAEGRAASARAERRLAERLAAIRDEFNIHLDLHRRTADVSSALRDYGVDIATLGPAEAGRRVAASPHADDVVDELDESILRGDGSGDVEGERRFLAVAEAADRDPWRREVRAVIARGDVAALRKLSEGLDFDKATTRGILNLAAALMCKARVSPCAGAAPGPSAAAPRRLLGQLRPGPRPDQSAEHQPLRGGVAVRRRRRRPPPRRGHGPLPARQPQPPRGRSPRAARGAADQPAIPHLPARPG